MSANLRLVSDNPDNAFPWPLTGELVSIPDAHHRIMELKEGKDALHRLLEERERKYRRQEKMLEEERDPRNQPNGKERVQVVEYWREVCGKQKSIVSKDRVKMAGARLGDGYTVEQLKLAIDALAAFPFRVFDKRLKTGRPDDRHDQLKDALGDSEKVEAMANLGHQARRQGWSPEGGWREERAA